MHLANPDILRHVLEMHKGEAFPIGSTIVETHLSEKGFRPGVAPSRFARRLAHVLPGRNHPDRALAGKISDSWMPISLLIPN